MSPINFRLLLLNIAQNSDKIRNEIFKFYEKHYGYKLKTDLIEEEINFNLAKPHA